MRSLHFAVSRQRISRSGDFGGLVRGSQGYLRAVFSFDAEWDGCAKAASFYVKGREYAQPVVDGTCMIPDEACGEKEFEVSVTGVRRAYRIVTDRVKVYQGG